MKQSRSGYSAVQHAIHPLFQATAGAQNSSVQNETGKGETKPRAASSQAKQCPSPNTTQPGKRARERSWERRELASEISQARTQHTDKGKESESQMKGFFGLTQEGKWVWKSIQSNLGQTQKWGRQAIEKNICIFIEIQINSGRKTRHTASVSSKDVP